MKIRNGVVIAILALNLFVLPGCESAVIVIIDWDNNTEPDLGGYKVYFGTAPGNYDNILDVGVKSRVYLSGLHEDLIYYFAITAYDLTGNESPFSREVQVTIPHGERSLLSILDDLDLSIYDVYYVFST